TEIDPVTQQTIDSEKFLNVSIDAQSSRHVPRVLEDDSDLVRVKKDNNDVWILPNVRPGEATTAATPASGGDGNDLTEGIFTGAGKEASKQGMFNLAKADLFNLLCIPPYLSSGDVNKTLIDAAAAYCAKRRAMLLIDPPTKW